MMKVLISLCCVWVKIAKRCFTWIVNGQVLCNTVHSARKPLDKGRCIHLIQPGLFKGLSTLAKCQTSSKHSAIGKQFGSDTAMGMVKRSHTLILTLIVWSCNKHGLQQNKYVISTEQHWHLLYIIFVVHVATAIAVTVVLMSL